MSNETKWTPGPWVVCPAGDIWSENLVSLVADTYSPVEANAHLIAAAPELYEALEDTHLACSKTVYGYDGSYAAKRNAAALARARGE